MDKESQNILQLRGQAWHQPSCIWLSSDLNLLSNVETTGTWDLLYQIVWLSLNLLFIKANKREVLMSIDEDNKDEPQLSHNGLHTHKVFPSGGNVKVCLIEMLLDNAGKQFSFCLPLHFRCEA